MSRRRYMAALGSVELRLPLRCLEA